MEYTPPLILLTLVVTVLAGLALRSNPELQNKIFNNIPARLGAAVAVGLGTGYILANPEPAIEVAVQFLPMFILFLYITAAIKIKRGLSSRDLVITLMLIACGVGYYVAKRQFVTSAAFALAIGGPVALSYIVHALLDKYRDSGALVKLRGTRFYRIMQTDIKL